MSVWSAAQPRACFPLLTQQSELIWLDSAATTQKPLAVLDAERAFYEQINANVHRGAHRLGHAATEAFEAARSSVAHFINSPSRQQVVFTRGATEAINLVAHSWGGSQLQAGDEILISMLEHHADIVPWQMLAARTGAMVKPIPLTDALELDLDALAAMLSPRTRLVCVTAMSNVLGTRPPLSRIIAMAHAVGARVLVDAAQALAHDVIDVQALDADFLVFSAHKVFGPTGIGALWARMELLEAMPPWQGGGEMIARVSFDGTTYAPPPLRFEAGTPAFAQAVGFAAALNWLQQQDRSAIAAHETALYQQLAAGIAHIDGVHILGAPHDKGPIASLAFATAHPYDVAQFLDNADIAVRVGNHCAEPLMQALQQHGTLRVSIAAYNSAHDITRLLAVLAETLELLA
ncbi:aminotransferase class V-fold PLP-dependent enzyme [Amantichitinum ursilacus]|uniref:Probable cysteine desulfurase n=1 Tax=Amantichitinum ursilacus TaxID=857265 RepID=A0A0N0XNV3_9NEIS|nr:cysteine desulfurase [Amantichitinum ursilacus]KPC55432.1 Cysteine desulfurase [Amantichitinum ursilacus]